MTGTFGDAIRGLREARGISQSALADRAGLSQSYVSMIESRQRGWQPSRNVVRAFAAGLGVKERELLEAADLDAYDEIEPALTVKEAIDADPYLAPREKKALTDLYRAMVWGRR